MYKKKNLIILAMCISVFIMIIVYAALQTQLTIAGAGTITSSWDIEIVRVTSKISGMAINIEPPAYSESNLTLKSGFYKPGDKIVYTITVMNRGSVDAIIDDVTITAEGSPAIIYYISDSQQDIRLEKGNSVTFDLTVEFDEKVTSIPVNAVKSLYMSIICVQDDGQDLKPSHPNLDGVLINSKYLSTQILTDNNNGQSDANIDFGQISSDTNGKGLYYTSNSNNNEDINGDGFGEIVYYYRGDVKNNFVKFGKDNSGNDLYWKIIRINEDGSIRMIYNGISPAATETGIVLDGASDKFATGFRDNAHVGYMYGLVDQSGTDAYKLTHSNINMSQIKITIDDWYTNKTNLSSFRTTHLSDAGFCNNRSVANADKQWHENDTTLGYAEYNTYYGSYNNIVNLHQPQFSCPNADNNLFTTNTSLKGNRALTNPIGLITADEVMYAGGVYATANTQYYLYADKFYWTMSPFSFQDEIANVFYVTSHGLLNGDKSNVSKGVRPVINLESLVELSTEMPSGCTKQNGTASCPYIIKID